MRLRDRPTADLIVMFLTAVVGLILLVSLVGIILIEVFRPTVDISTLTTRIGTLTSSLIGAIIGYLAGRAQSGGNNSS